jgi:hypothetical protein
VPTSVLERLRAAHTQSLGRVADVLTAASDAGRDLTDDEKQLLTREQTATESLERQIGAESDRQLAEARRAGELATATREAGNAGVPLGGAMITRSEPVYRIDRPGHRYFRDLLLAREQNDPDARERLRRARAHRVEEVDRHEREAHTRAGTSAALSGGAFMPPGYRPELFVDRPVDPPELWNALAPYPISDANPFQIPKVKTGTAVDDQAGEGAPPTETNLAGELISVTPVTKTGKNTWARQAIEGSNPAIDLIVADDLRRELNSELEILAAGVVFAPAATDPVVGTGVELLDGMTAAAFAFAGARKQPPQVYVTGWAEAGVMAGAKGTDGRPLMPVVTPTNTQGGAGGEAGLQQRWQNLPVLHSGPAPALRTAVIRLGDVAAFGSPVLEFYFVEVKGPENIVLGVWQYAAAVIRQALGVRIIERSAVLAQKGK